MSIISILVFLLILTVIVTLHEAGHFLTAKKFGVYCKEFAIGMGPKLWQRKTSETTYSIRAIPMGGYVQMIGEEGELFTIKKDDIIWLKFNETNQVSEIYYKNPNNSAVEVRVVSLARSKQPMELTYIESGIEKTAETTALVTCYDADGEQQDLVANNRQFNHLTPLKKIVVLTAGVCMNFLLAFVVLFVATWLAGVNVAPVIATDSTTDVANRFEANDRILRVNDQMFSDATTLTNYIRQNSGKKVDVVVDRAGHEVVLHRAITEATGQTLTEQGVETFTYGILGVTYQRDHWHLLKILEVTMQTFFGFFEYVYFVLVGLFTGKIALTNLTGFVGIAQQTDMVINTGVGNVDPFGQFIEVLARIFNFTAFLSVNIGVMNILPFPALDGGRVLFALYELIFHKKPNPKFETYFNACGFILLIGLFVGVTVLDIIRLLNA